MAMAYNETQDISSGDTVTLMSASLGWGAFHKGMVGTVISMGESSITVEVAGTGTFHCHVSDVVKKEGRVEQRLSIAKFFEAQVHNERAELERVLATIEKYNGMDEDDMTDTQDMEYRNAVKRRRALRRVLNCVVAPDTDVFKMLSNKVSQVRFEGSYMTLWTKDIVVPYYIEERDITVHVPLGRFKVVCKFDSKETWFHTFENNVDYNGNYHPHISGRSACWGSYGDTVARAYKTLDINTLIATILDFLNSCYREGWYQSILGFARGTVRDEIGQICYRCEYESCECENHCHDCEQHIDDCSCNTCGECGYHEEECECVRCPDHGDRLEENTFPDHHCAGCSNLIRNLDDGQWVCGAGDWLYASLESYQAPASTDRRPNAFVTINGGTEI